MKMGGYKGLVHFVANLYDALFSPLFLVGVLMHKIFWLWIPIVALCLQVCIEIMFSKDVLAVMHSENGPHELLQFLVLLFAFCVAVSTLMRVEVRKNLWLCVWFFIASLCCFYVAAEEVSWGQHFMQWSTPEYWSHINDQQETNLHNTSSWLDQKPRLLLEIGVVVGGILIPLLLKFSPSLLPERFSLIYPSVCLSVTAGIFLFLKIMDKLEAFDVLVFERGSEVQELYLFYFVLLYLIMLRKKVFPSPSL